MHLAVKTVGSEGIAPLILNLCFSYRSILMFTARTFPLSQGKRPWYCWTVDCVGPESVGES